MQNFQLPVICPPFKSNPALGTIKKSVRTLHKNLGGIRKKGKQTFFAVLAVKLPYVKSHRWQSEKKEVLLDTRRWNQDVNRVRQTSIRCPTNSITQASAVADAPNNCPQTHYYPTNAHNVKT